MSKLGNIEHRTSNVELRISFWSAFDSMFSVRCSVFDVGIPLGHNLPESGGFLNQIGGRS